VVQKMIVNYLGNQKAVLLSDVIAIEASEAYSVIHDKNGMQYTMSKNLKYFESLLEDNNGFMRVHKSWIVNNTHITQVSNADYTIFLSNQLEAKLSKYKKAEFDEWYKGK
jgi:two-component system, LytTR family, response regulator